MSSKPLVLITGVSRAEGIGYGVAKQMASSGFQVIISARSLSVVKALAKQLSKKGAKVIEKQLDITNEKSVTTMAEFIKKKLGRLDILINNAGCGFDFNIEPMSTEFEMVKQAFETNLFGTWRMIKIMYPLLKASAKPRIVNLSSGAGSFTHPAFGLAVHPAFMTAYGLSKLALNGLTVQIARELAKDKIVVTAVNPGFVATAPGMVEMGARNVDASTEGIIWAATLDDESLSGKFFEDKKEIGW